MKQTQGHLETVERFKGDEDVETITEVSFIAENSPSSTSDSPSCRPDMMKSVVQALKALRL